MKKLYKVFILILCLAMLQGCGSTKVNSKDYDEEKLKTESEEMIKKFCDEKYDEVVAKFEPTLKEKIKVEEFKKVGDKYKELGKFQSITKRSIEEKQGVAVTTSVAKYEKGQAIYTITFNKKMEMTNFFIK